MAEDFAFDVVQVGFEDGDGIGLPVVGGRGAGGAAENGAENVGAGPVVPRAQADADLLDGQLAHRAEVLGEFG